MRAEVPSVIHGTGSNEDRTLAYPVEIRVNPTYSGPDSLLLDVLVKGAPDVVVRLHLDKDQSWMLRRMLLKPLLRDESQD